MFFESLCLLQEGDQPIITIRKNHLAEIQSQNTKCKSLHSFPYFLWWLRFSALFTENACGSLPFNPETPGYNFLKTPISFLCLNNRNPTITWSSVFQLQFNQLGPTYHSLPNGLILLPFLTYLIVPTTFSLYLFWVYLLRFCSLKLLDLP